MPTSVHTFAQIFAGLEVRYILAGQRYSLTGLGITPDTRRTVVQGKTPKASDFDALAPGQGIAHDVQQMLNC